MEGGGRIGRAGSGPSISAEFYLGHYRWGKKLGVGTVGEVNEAEHTLTGHKVVIKTLDRRKIQFMDMKEKLMRELKILRLFMHPHIIRVYEVIETPTEIFVIMEYMKNGDLFYYIVEKGGLQEPQARRLFQQIVSAVDYCHRNRVVHRYLTPENLWLDSNWSVKIADFGPSNIMRDGHFLKTSCGSVNYAAPEVISRKVCAGPEIDVWSCGVILYALLCGILPSDDENMPNQNIKEGIYTLPSHFSPGARDLIHGMLLVDPVKRVSISEIRQHQWFQEHLPRYLAVPPPDANEQTTEIDEDVLQAVVHMGFDKSHVMESLRNRVQNQATASYHLTLDNRLPISYGCF